MSETTYWHYTFWWKGAQCEAKDGFIFINGKRVEEFPNVNWSSQTDDQFFIEGKDVTGVMLRYLEAPAALRSEEIKARTQEELLPVAPTPVERAAKKRRLMNALMSVTKKKGRAADSRETKK